LAVCQNLVPLVNIKIAGKWMFIPLKMVLIGIDPYPLPQNHEAYWEALGSPGCWWWAWWTPVPSSSQPGSGTGSGLFVHGRNSSLRKYAL